MKKTINDNFEQTILDYTVLYDDLAKNNYEFLGVAKGKDGYKDLHVFEKDKYYYYFKFHKDYHILDDEYEFIIKTDYMADNVVKD